VSEVRQDREVCCSALQVQYFAGVEGCSVMQSVAVRCSVLQCVAVCCSLLQCIAVFCSVLQRVCSVWGAVCCRGCRGSVLQGQCDAV